MIIFLQAELSLCYVEPFSLHVHVSTEHPGLNPHFCLLLGFSSCISASGFFSRTWFCFQIPSCRWRSVQLALEQLRAGPCPKFSSYSPVIIPCIFQWPLICPFLSDFYTSLKKVLGNRMYFTFLCCSLLQFSGFIGFLTYKPKYMEQQYGQSTSKSNFLIGEFHCARTACAVSTAWGWVLVCFIWGWIPCRTGWGKWWNLNYKKTTGFVPVGP